MRNYINNRSRYLSTAKMSSLSLTEKLRFVALALMLLLCALSSVPKISNTFTTFSSSINRKIIDVTVDKSLCNTLKSCKIDCKVTFDECSSEFSSAFAQATSTCKGYIEKSISCQRSKSANNCKVEVDNAQSCVNAIVKKDISSWDKYKYVEGSQAS